MTGSRRFGNYMAWVRRSRDSLELLPRDRGEPAALVLPPACARRLPRSVMGRPEDLAGSRPVRQCSPGEVGGDVLRADGRNVQVKAAGDVQQPGAAGSWRACRSRGSGGAARTTFALAKAGGMVRAASSRGRRHRRASPPTQTAPSPTITPATMTSTWSSSTAAALAAGAHDGVLHCGAGLPVGLAPAAVRAGHLTG
jgi:hypothetical protein